MLPIANAPESILIPGHFFYSLTDVIIISIVSTFGSDEVISKSTVSTFGSDETIAKSAVSTFGSDEIIFKSIISPLNHSATECSCIYSFLSSESVFPVFL